MVLLYIAYLIAGIALNNINFYIFSLGSFLLFPPKGWQVFLKDKLKLYGLTKLAVLATIVLVSFIAA